MLLDVALELETKAARRSKPSHWLCELLADAADAVDPTAVAAAAADAFSEALVRIGVPGWIAAVAGRGVAKAAENALASALPGAQLCLGLRVLGIMACPAPEACPAGTRLSGPLLRAAVEDLSLA